MATKGFKNKLQEQWRSQPPAPEEPDQAWAFSGLLRDRLEKAAEPLPVETIAVTELHDNPYQSLARSRDDAAVQDEKLEELAESIRANGFYGALLARTRSEGGYELAYGHRRRDAAARAGLETLPVKVMTLDDAAMARIMASENFSREDLTPLGEANVVGHLHTALGMSVREIARSVGRDRGWVENRLNLFRAPAELKEMVEARPDSMSFVETIVKVADPVAREALARDVVDKRLTQKQLKAQLAPKLSLPTTPSPKLNKFDFGPAMAQLDAALTEIERNREGQLFTAAEIRLLKQFKERLELLGA
jgi:ParB family chromosome partitioning protein